MNAQPAADLERSRRRFVFGVVVWSGFLAACCATLVFFGYFDPPLLVHDEDPPRWLADRMTGYAVGFFFFWFMSLIAAAITAFMLDRR